MESSFTLKGLFTQYNCSLRFSFKQSGLYNCVSYQHVAYITVLRTSIWKKTCNILELIPYIMMINCLINYMINYRCSLRACLACLERNEALQPWSSFKTRENNYSANVGTSWVNITTSIFVVPRRRIWDSF